MARKRMIDPEFWSDEEIGNWTYEARLFYIGLWNFADDEGRFKAHEKLLKAQIFPYDDKIDIKSIKKVITSKVEWYKINKQEYGLLCNFLKHQRIDRPTPSKLPSPLPISEGSANTRGTLLPNIREVNIREEKIREEKEPFEGFVSTLQSHWNTLTEQYPILPKILTISPERRKHLKHRFSNKHFRDNILLAIDTLRESSFLRGVNDRAWKVSFDWFISNDTNYVKVLEGKYKDKDETGIQRFITGGKRVK